MLKIATKKQKHIIEYMGAKFTVEPNTKDEQQSIIKSNTFTHKVKTGPGQKDQYEERIDWIGVQSDNMDSQVVAWDGIADKLECNSENKRALAACKENEHICTYIQEEIAKIGQAQEESDKKKAKG
jgi:hypothetical protein